MKTKQLPQGWKEKPFLECLEKEASNNKLKIPQKDFLEEGIYPIIDQGDNVIAGYTNDETKVYSEKLPVVVFGDHTRVFKFIKFPFAIGADGTKILVPIKELNPKFFYYMLRKLNLPSAGYSRHYKFLKEKSLVIPPLETQQKIVSVLEKAEQLKEKRKKSIEILDEYLKSVFSKMFLKKKINFEGFLDIFNITTGKIDSNAMEEDGIYPFFTCSQETFKINNYAFDCEALLLAGNNAAGKYSIKYYNGKFNAYQRTYVLTLKDKKNNLRYFHFVIKNKLEELRNASIGTNTKYLTLGILKTMKLPLPSPGLQQEFASIVKHVEKLKEKQKKSQEEIEDLFNALMQKAFKGELI